ncbi:MAG: pilus assembly protein [Emcibacter sp.]|nr:pilus assembly protein [Emcibacter sp.]
MKQIFKKLATCVQGIAAVELALIFPVMLLMIVGALDMGSMFVRKMELANAVKAGVQYSLVRKPIQNDVTSIEAAVEASLGTVDATITSVNVELFCKCFSVKQLCSLDCADANGTSHITVTIKENYSTPFFNYDWFVSSFPITETSTIRLN